MKSTKKFQKIATNDTMNEDDVIDMDTKDSIQVIESTKTITSKILCFVAVALLLLTIGFVFGYFINAETKNDSTSTAGTNADHDYVIRDPSCLTRKCCKPKDGIKHDKCVDLLLIDCVTDSQYCEWDCDPSPTPRKRTFYGISTGIGSFPETNQFETNNNDSSGPSSVDELIEMSRMISIDDCGVMYEETMHYERAQQEFAELKNLSMIEQQQRRRRMQGGGGLVGSDNQVEIGNDGGGLVGSQESIGCITYSSSRPGWGQTHTNEPTYYYDHICSGTLIAPQWVLTSGQCCHPGHGGENNYYGNWYYYPEIRHYDDISTYRSSTSSVKAYKVVRAYSYGAWVNSWSNKYDWDICVLKLQYPYHGHYMQLAYHGFNNDGWNSLGYRYDRYSSANNYLIYGWQSQTIYSYSSYYFSYTMDVFPGSTSVYGNGYAGAPFYYSDSKQYCVVSNQYNRYGHGRNYCTRITTTIYRDFCGSWWYNGREYFGYGHGYCS